jgi:hypothetical protein
VGFGSPVNETVKFVLSPVPLHSFMTGVDISSKLIKEEAAKFAGVKIPDGYPPTPTPEIVSLTNVTGI